MHSAVICRMFYECVHVCLHLRDTGAEYGAFATFLNLQCPFIVTACKIVWKNTHSKKVIRESK